MNEELRQLAALGALGGLSPEDSRRLEDALLSDDDLALEVELDRAVVEAMEGVLAREVGSADLGDRLVAAARADLEGADARAMVIPARTRTRRRWRPAIGGALVAAAAAVAAITIVVTRDSGLGTPDQQVDIVAADPTSPVHGRAALYDPDRPGGHVVVDLESLGAAPSGHHYEVWVLRKGTTVMEPVGSFASKGSPVHLELDLPAGGDYAALDISIEEDAGPPEHSGTSVAGAKFGTS